MGKKKTAWRKAVDDSIVAEAIAKEGQKRRREAGLEAAGNSELFFEDKAGRASKGSVPAGGKLKKTQVARSKLLKSFTSLAKSDTNYSGRPRKEAKISKRKQKEFQDFMMVTAKKADRLNHAGKPQPPSSESKTQRNDAWSLTENSSDVAQREVKSLGRLNVAKEASSVNPDERQFSKARAKVEAEIAKAEQEKALIRQKIPSEAVRSRMNMSSIDAGVDEILLEIENSAAEDLIQQREDGNDNEKEEQQEETKEKLVPKTRKERKTRRDENKRRRQVEQQQELMKKQRIKKQRKDIAAVHDIVEAIKNDEIQVDEGIQQRRRAASAKAHDALEKQRDINGGGGGVYEPPKVMRKAGGAAAATGLRDRFTTLQMRGLVVKSAAAARNKRKNRPNARKTYIQGSKGWKEEEMHKETLREKNMKAAIVAPALDIVQ